MNGMIGFFDILGYQSFLENNSAENSALEVLSLITGIPAETKAEFTRRWAAAIKYDTYNFAEAIEHLIFSDTIVFLIRYPDDCSTRQREQAITAMFVAASSLAAKMFMKGLPVRGVVHEGDFVKKDYCIAGSGIVHAYQQCAQLDFAGVTLSATLADYVEKRNAEPRPMYNATDIAPILVPILSPLKGSAESRLTHVNWLRPLKKEDRASLEKDVTQFVLRSFWAHGKDCALSVDAKVQNTAKMIRRLMVALDSESDRANGAPKNNA